jgi:hypothetical protein
VRHDIVHVRLAREVLEGPTHPTWREPHAPPEGLEYVAERRVERRPRSHAARRRRKQEDGVAHGATRQGGNVLAQDPHRRRRQRDILIEPGLRLVHDLVAGRVRATKQYEPLVPKDVGL